MKKIGERIKYERLHFSEKRISQVEFAQILGYSEESVKTIRKWEQGKVIPDIGNLIELCNLFDCDLGYLLCEYDCKRHKEADVQKVTGLSETAIKNLEDLKNSPYAQITDIINAFLEHEDLPKLLEDIYTHIWNYNENIFNGSDDNLKKISEAMNCKKSNAKDYMKVTSESLIKSTFMNIVNSIHLFENGRKKQKKEKLKRLFDYNSKSKR